MKASNQNAWPLQPLVESDMIIKKQLIKRAIQVFNFMVNPPLVCRCVQETTCLDVLGPAGNIYCSIKLNFLLLPNLLVLW